MWEAYAGNDGVRIVVSDKILDGPWCCYSQMVAADEVGSEIESGCVRAWIPRARLLFGGVCIAVCRYTIGLGRPADS